MKTLKKILEALLLIVGATAVFFGTQVVLSLLSSVFLAVIPIFLFGEYPPEVLKALPTVLLRGIMNDYTMITVFFSNLLTVAVILLAAYGISLWKRHSFTDLLSLRKIRLSSTPLLFAFGVALNAAIGLLWEAIPFPESWIDAYESSMAGLTEMNFLTFLAVAISAPLAEELVCRSVFLSGFRRFLPAWAALVLSSLLFAAMHGNPYQVSYAFVGGIFLGLVFLLYNSVTASVVMHFGFNAATFLFQLFHFLPENDTGALIANISLIAIAALSIPIFLLLLRDARLSHHTEGIVEAKYTEKENTNDI